MIDNILFKYMDRLQIHQEEAPKKEPGPVITISRDYGCFAGEIAEKLATRISEENLKAKKEKWTWISKEIINDAANKLQTNSNQLKHFFDGEASKFLADIAISFSKSYASDDLIKRTVTKVVRTYAYEGNVIIVGRAGCMIAKEIQHSLHIKLIAPLDWRIKAVSIKDNVNEAQAIKLIEENDKKRANFMKVFNKNRTESEMFDVIFNRGTLTTDQIVDHILLLAKEKNLY